VTASPVRGGEPGGAGETNADGRYLITGLELRKTYLVAIEVEGGRQDAGRVALKTNETTFDMNLPLGGPAVSSTTSATTSTETTSTSTATDTTSTATDTSSTSTDTTSTSTDTTSTSTDTSSTSTSTDTSSTSTDTTSTSTGTTSTSTSTATVAPAPTATVEPSFAALEQTLRRDEWAAEGKVNIEEARELARVFVLSMFLLARVPEAVERVYAETRPTYQVGDLTLQEMDQLDDNVRTLMQSIVDRRTHTRDTEQAILEEIRASRRSGRGSTSAPPPSPR
jgi:hypothetical protein